MSSDTIRFLADVAGDSALALRTAFMPNLVEAYRDQVVLFPWRDENTGASAPFNVVSTKVIQTGYSHRFLMMSDLPEAEDHTPGMRLEGQPFGIAEGNVTVDGYVVAHVVLPNDQLRLSDFDVVGPLGKRLGRSLARRYDNRLFRLATLAARAGMRTKTVDGVALNIHNGGNRVERIAASVALAYPLNATGAKNFRDDASALARAMDDDYIPEEGRYLFCTPYIRQVLEQDPGIFDSTLTRNITNSLNQRMIGEIAGFKLVVVAGRIPNTNVTTGPTKYQGDFRVAGPGEPVAVALCDASAGTAAISAVVADGIVPEMEKEARTSTTFMKASILMGADQMHVWNAGVIEVDDS